MTKIILSADSTCDLGDELKAKYQVHYYPFHIILGDKQYQDNVDITPEEIFQAYWERKILPKTAAIGVGEYLDYFRKWVENGYQVIHLNLGSGISSAYQNCCMAARELGNVFPINSGNLSSAIGLLVVEAGKEFPGNAGAPDSKGDSGADRQMPRQLCAGYPGVSPCRRKVLCGGGSGSESASVKAVH
ncbi:MAG: DegV family protein [[Clostridium] leptum]